MLGKTFNFLSTKILPVSFEEIQKYHNGRESAWVHCHFKLTLNKTDLNVYTNKQELRKLLTNLINFELRQTKCKQNK